MRFRQQSILVLVLLAMAAGAGVYAYKTEVTGQSSNSGQSRTDGDTASGDMNGPSRRDEAKTDGVTSGNRLANSSSPYLQMHADNPVHWYPWGKAAFEQARQSQKPIFLSVGYSTCYWCHVMERESFSSEAVAKELNANFVSIKLDREQRPAVDQIYMNALHLMGQRGGWPMSIFLTPNLKPFIGGTYFPRDKFLDFIDKVDRAWREQKDQVIAHANKLAVKLEQVETMTIADKVPGNTPVQDVSARLQDTYDELNGGFGNAPKFPQPAKLDFLLTRYQQTGNDKALNMVEETLDSMAQGGVYDQVGGGFHRYSTDDFWDVPHFEKMLYDNAQLLYTYARTYEITGNHKHKQTGIEISDYVDRVMTGPHGMFYSAMDSETNHEEGQYYVWTRQEIKNILDPAEYKFAETVYGLSQTPNFEGDHYVLQWAAGYQVTADHLDMTTNQLFDKLIPVRDKLLTARVKRKKPLIDDKVIVSWNGLMIQSLAYAGAQFDVPVLVQSAGRAADALWQRLHRDGELLHVYRNGQAKFPAYLDDYAAFMLGLTQLYEVTGKEIWQQRAVILADAMIARLWGSEGGFYYSQAEDDSLLVRTRGGFDGAMPSGNSLASKALLELVEQGYERFLPYLAGTFKAYASHLQRHPSALVTMTETLSRYHATDYSRTVAMPNAAIDNLQDLVDNQNLPANGRPVDTTMKSDRYVKLQVDVQKAEIDNYRFQASFELAEGWHINANPASLDFLIPTTIRAVKGDSPVEVQVDYPEGKLLKAGLREPIAVYDGRTDIPFRISAEADTPGQIRILARVQACNNDGRCLLPATIKTTVNTED